ncbi:MAG TPA: 2-dehydropantoate 2-reductase N-terminal domain-containing protein, partial [Candidatus Limnocylindria bacterium]|nr:2-dehydropantoate 2-reductase N-terminal domain-containing protein [Candidatus Limnocylindria bacterium]
MERVCVVGAGVIGGLYAAHLARVAEVSVLTRREEHARALVEQGLRVSGKSDFVASVFATARVEELPDFELGILATKATELEEAGARLEGRFPDATLMTVQNGLGAEEVVRGHGAWPLISGVTFMSGTRHSDTHVEYVLDTPTWLGAYESTPFGVVEEIASLLTAAGHDQRRPGEQRGAHGLAEHDQRDRDGGERCRSHQHGRAGRSGVP